MKFGAYYSGGLDWHRRPFPAMTTHASVRELRPLDEDYARIAAEHLRDLIQKYQPEILWNDIDWPDAGKNFEEFGIGTVFQEYYSAVPDGLVNNRWHVPHADYLTSEYQFMLDGERGAAWENCRGIGFSFGYNQNEEQASLDSAGVIRHLLDVTTRGGHLLLGVGPKADGSLPDFQMRVLELMATWMEAGGSLLPQMGPASAYLKVEIQGSGFFKVGKNPGGTYLFVDNKETHEPISLVTKNNWTLLTPNFATVTKTNDGLEVMMNQNRPGAAIFKLEP